MMQRFLEALPGALFALFLGAIMGAAVATMADWQPTCGNGLVAMEAQHGR